MQERAKDTLCQVTEDVIVVTLVNEVEVRSRWKKYFERVLNVRDDSGGELEKKNMRLF